MNNRLSRTQVLMIGCAYVLDSTLISKPGLVIRDLKSDFWIAHVLALGYGLIAVMVFAALASRFPRKDFFEGIVSASPFVGRTLVAGYVIYSFGLLTRDLRASSDFVKVTLLTNTFQIVKGGSHLYSYMGEAVGIFMIASQRSWSFRYSLYSVLLGAFLLALLTIAVVISLGVEIPARTFYPNYELIRKLRLTDFLDRLDLPIIGVWLPAMIVKTSFGLYIVAYGLSYMLPKSWKLSWIAAASAAVAAAAAMFLFRNALQVLLFDAVWLPVSFVFQIGLPALLLLFVRKRKKPPTVSAAKGGTRKLVSD